MLNQNKGFTIVELIVAMGLTGIVMAGAYKTFTWQQNVYYAQDAAASAQQGVRAGLDILVRDLRMAGYSPLSEVAGITTATGNKITFTVDSNDNGVIDGSETITYSLSPEPPAAAPPNGRTLMRQVGGGALDPVADNIDVLDFVYFDAAGAAIAAPVATAALPTISSLQITLVAKSGKADKNYTDKNAYRRQPAPNTTNTPGAIVLAAPNDNFRRRLLTTTVRCRNLGAK